MNANQARENYQQALVLAHELAMRPLEAQCHFALGELALKAGEKRGAQEQFDTAVSMFREMGMQFWLPLMPPRAPDVASREHQAS